MPSIKERFARNALLKQVVDVSEIGGLALFLASDASRFITGSELRIDGGACLIGPS